MCVCVFVFFVVVVCSFAFLEVQGLLGRSLCRCLCLSVCASARAAFALGDVVLGAWACPEFGLLVLRLAFLTLGLGLKSLGRGCRFWRL